MVEKAARMGAQLVVLPEIFYYPYELDRLSQIAEEDRQTLGRLMVLAKKLNIFLCTGSMVEKHEGKLFNTCYLLDPDGHVILEYSKCHLFDVELPGLKARESDVFSGGNQLSLAETPLGNIGLLICYDIRFPEMSRLLTLKGMEILLVPAAFNTVTGPAHWYITFRCRAVENQVYVAAASQARGRRTRYKAYGHSMIIDPWGKVITSAAKNEEIIYGSISKEVLKKTREALPLLKHRRPELYH
jgi:omega-amidase